MDNNKESFEIMLDNIYNNLNINNNNTRIELPKPILIKSGQKTIWKNPHEFINMFNRQSDDFTNYINNKSSTQIIWLTDTISDGCIFNIKIKNSDYITNIMRSYVNDRIICKSCKSINTIITKDNNLRKYKFTCYNCNTELYI
jgi:translation initiation factor 2 beta subunit (eIF-2beta)/eIF-5